MKSARGSHARAASVGRWRCAWTGSVGGDHWSGGTRDVDYFDMQGVVERVCQALRVDVQLEPVHESWLVPGRAAAILAAGTRIGSLGQLAPSLVEQHGVPASDAIFVAELDLDSVSAVDDDLQVEPLPRHPSVTRDISILVADTLPAATVRRTIREHAPEILARVSEFDRYQGKGVPDGQVSLSLRLTFRAPDRTLTDDDVQAAMNDGLGRAQGSSSSGATLITRSRWLDFVALGVGVEVVESWELGVVGNWVLRSWELSWHHLHTLSMKRNLSGWPNRR